MDKKNVHLINLYGQEAAQYISSLAKLRMEVFSDWPYLYDGTLELEQKYLKTLFESKNSFVCLAKTQNEEIVGASTAIWLPEANVEFIKPFKDKNFNIETIYYYGESVLQKKFRGLGIGTEFMRRRQGFATSIKGITHVAFCAVERPADHPLKPLNYFSLEEFWKKNGFQKQSDMTAKYSWKDHGDKNDTFKSLQFWIKELA